MTVGTNPAFGLRLEAIPWEQFALQAGLNKLADRLGFQPRTSRLVIASSYALRYRPAGMSKADGVRFASVPSAFALFTIM